MFLILLQNISSTSKFHNYAERWRLLVIKGFFVSYDILFIVVWCQNSDFVEGVLSLFFFHWPYLYLDTIRATFLSAYSLPSALRFTLKTWPKAPSPSLDWTSKSLKLEALPYIINITQMIINFIIQIKDYQSEWKEKLSIPLSEWLLKRPRWSCNIVYLYCLFFYRNRWN